MGAMVFPIASTRRRSPWCVATRWSTVSITASPTPVSSTARESPRLATVSSQPICGSSKGRGQGGRSAGAW